MKTDFDEFEDFPGEDEPLDTVAGPAPPKFKKSKLTSRKLAQLHFDVLDELGGVTYLLEQARRDPKSFMTRLGTLLPKNVDISGSTEVNIFMGERQPDTRLGVVDHTSESTIEALQPTVADKVQKMITHH